jgi:hypothetical protein
VFPETARLATARGMRLDHKADVRHLSSYRIEMIEKGLSVRRGESAPVQVLEHGHERPLEAIQD